MKVGDLVQVSPAVAAPEKYGIGFVEKIAQYGTLPSDATVYVRWPVFPGRSISCGRYALRIVNAGR